MKPNDNNRRGLLSGLSGNVIALGVVSLLNDTSTELIYPLLPLFLSSGLHASTLFIGLIEGVAETTASLFKLFSGYFSDKMRVRKPLALFGYTLSSLTRPIIAIAFLPWHILLARTVDRVGKGMRSSPRDALLAASCDESVRGKAFGLHRSFDHMGAIIGPLLASLILFIKPGAIRTVFWIAVIPAFMSVAVLLFYVREKAPDRLPSQPLKLGASMKSLPPNLRWFILGLIAFTLGNSSDAFLILRARDMGVSVAMIPILWVYFHVIKMVVSTPAGILSDRIGRKKSILSGWLIYAAVYAGFGLASSELYVWVLMGVYGVFYGLTEGVEKAYVADMVGSDLRGTAFGFYNLAIGIMAFPASLIMGYLWDGYGVLIAFLFGSIMAAVASLILFFFVSEIRGEKNVRKA